MTLVIPSVIMAPAFMIGNICCLAMYKRKTPKLFHNVYANLHFITFGPQCIKIYRFTSALSVNTDQCTQIICSLTIRYPGVHASAQKQ